MSIAPFPVLALWNGVLPAWQASYEAWHPGEHVPERLCAPGLRKAWRYHAADGAPDYFTLYLLDDFAALHSPQYRSLIDHPSPWSAAMRPRLTGFVRQPARLHLPSLAGDPGAPATAQALDALPRLALCPLPASGHPPAAAAGWLQPAEVDSSHPLALGKPAGAPPSTAPAGGWALLPDRNAPAGARRWQLASVHHSPPAPAHPDAWRPAPRHDLFARFEGTRP